jgi:hypothetical protein
MIPPNNTDKILFQFHCDNVDSHQIYNLYAGNEPNFYIALPQWHLGKPFIHLVWPQIDATVEGTAITFGGSNLHSYIQEPFKVALKQYLFEINYRLNQ